MTPGQRNAVACTAGRHAFQTSRRARHVCWTVTVAAALACSDRSSSRDDAGAGLESEPLRQCRSAADCGLGEICVDGYCDTASGTSRPDEGCQTDEQCPQGHACANTTGQCLPVAEEPTAQLPTQRACSDGDERFCGSKIGECRYGIQRCSEGFWEEACHGGVGPTAERCNGLDDDCDGHLPADETDLDTDGVMLCDGDCDDSEPTVLPGGVEVCDGLDNNCDGTVDEGAPQLCTDGVFCNGAELCHLGSCRPGAPPDCSRFASRCTVGTCDPSLDACAAAPKPDGTACDDGLYCSAGDVCQAGLCRSGPPRDCSAAGGSCRAGTCDEVADACTGALLVDGTPCDDSRYCTVDDQCRAGTCRGSARDCNGVGNACNRGVCDETLDTCTAAAREDGTGCDDGLFCTEDDHCVSGVCRGGSARSCESEADACNVAFCDDDFDRCAPRPKPDGTPCADALFCNGAETCQDGFCAAGVDPCEGVADVCELAVCREDIDECRVEPVTVVDGDGDGSNECLDCDDADSGVYPGAPELCNFVDDNCDGVIDEGFDLDGDGYTSCGGDCDDDDVAIHPEADECNPDGTPDGMDNNCNGYRDEGCEGCDPVDDDGDGQSECEGDCDDDRDNVYAGAPELCDGLDNDCNQYTVDNCHVSDPCNWPENTDRCADDLLCGCALDSGGACTGDYLCTSFCNASTTGDLGDTCAEDTQICLYDVLRTANVHGCAEVDFALGWKSGGESCIFDWECRSGRCAFEGFCRDYCGSDAYCPASGTVCSFDLADRDSDGSIDNVDGVCWRSAWLGSLSLGEACTYHGECDHYFCAEGPGEPSRYCSHPCCQSSDCPAGFGCSLRGAALAAPAVLPLGLVCTDDADCPLPASCDTVDGECVYRLSETVPACLTSPAGSAGAWAPCIHNGDCASNFCAEVEGVNVCIEVCCSDATCPEGLSCELQWVQTTEELVTEARVCVNAPTSSLLAPRAE